MGTFSELKRYLNHECWRVCLQVVVTANPGEDLIGYSKRGIFCWYKWPNLCHDLKKGYLTQVCRFSTLCREMQRLRKPVNLCIWWNWWYFYLINLFFQYSWP